MASHNGQVDDDLTTDAVPSPNNSSNEKVGDKNNVYIVDQSDDIGQFEDRIRANVDNCPGPGKSKHSIHKIPPIPGRYLEKFLDTAL